jgi:hypothetical protein
MRKTIVSFALAASLAVAPSVARADSQGTEALFAFASAFCNLGYTPAKVLTAAVGAPLGAMAGLLNGGDARAAYAFWVPTMGGTYFLTADMMDGREPVEFFGSDYADRPGTYGRSHYSMAAYEAMYVERAEDRVDRAEDRNDRD